MARTRPGQRAARTRHCQAYSSKNEEGIGTDKPMSGGLEVKTRLAKDLAEVISKTLTKKIT